MRAPPSYVTVWLLLVLAWAANFVIRIGFSALLPPIIADLGLSYTRAGVLAGAFFWAYMAMQIPAGLLGDRFGRRRILLIGLVGGAGACALTGMAGSFAALVLARVLTGACQGSLFSNDRAIIVAVTPADKIGLGQGVSFSGPGVGLTLGLFLGGILGERLSWRPTFWLFSLGPLLAAFCIARWAPAPPPPLLTGHTGRRLLALLRPSRLWALGLLSLCGIYVQFVLATWGPLFFKETGVEALGRAGTYASLQGVAAVAGLVAGGFADDRMRRRGYGHTVVVAVALAALSVSVLAMAGAIASRSPTGLAVALFVSAFFCWSIWAAVYALLGEMVSGERLATAFGVLNTMSFLGAVVGPPLTGWVRDVAGSFAPGCLLAAGVALVGAVTALAVRMPSTPSRLGASSPAGR
jgi:predicted MFS family arabinose efflux permease